MYELSDKTKEYLKNYDTPVDIYILAGESEQDGNIRTVLDKYAAANKNINVTIKYINLMTIIFTCIFLNVIIVY
mgnify:CR=1 FL=1